MSQIWKSTPQFKIELNSAATTITNDEAIEIQVIRPENNISHAVAVVNDYKSKNYITKFDPFIDMDISFRYGTSSWTKVFSGIINNVSPNINQKGETLEVTAWGWEWALLKTFCSTNYGTQSAQATVGGHPEDIIEDIITNYVNKAFGSGGASTQWALDITDVETVLDATAITFINGSYIDNFSIINRICEIVNAYAGSQSVASCHWYTDVEKHFRFKQISADAADGNWDKYWGGTGGTDPGTQASSTIAVTKDMVQYDFRKNIDEYANKVILCTDLRVPGYDYFTESGSSLWGSDQGGAGNPNIDLSNDAICVVGSNSLCAEQNTIQGYFWYPSGKNLSWNLTKIGSKDTIPSIAFYARRTSAPAVSNFIIHLNNDASNYWTLDYDLTTLLPTADQWYHLDFPVGPYFATKLEADQLRWGIGLGNPNWTDIDYIEFYLQGTAHCKVYIDDLHLRGKVIREAKDSSEITATKKEHQKIIRCDNAVDDLFREGTPGTTDVGTAARITYAELLRRSRTNRVGLIQIPLAETILPGQTIHVHAGLQSSGSYNINDDFRVKELRHNFMVNGATTQLNLTDDVLNTFAFGVPNAYSLLIDQLQGLNHGQARDLKSSGIDPLIPRLAESY